MQAISFRFGRRVPVAIASLLLLSWLLAGCESPQQRRTVAQVEDADLIAVSHQAAQSLLGQLAGEGGQSLIVASFANIDDLQQSSSFGRIVAQQLASQFAGNNYKVVEMLLRDRIYIARGEGEFMLSREVRNISAQHQVDLILVGTYAVGANTAFVNARVVSAKRSRVLAAHDFALPLGPDMRALLRN